MEIKNEKEFDEVVGRKLSDYTEQPPRGLFSRIERSLGEEGAPAAIPAAVPKKKIIRRIYRYAAAAAILAGVVFFSVRVWDTRPGQATADRVEKTGGRDADMGAVTPEKAVADVTPDNIAADAVSVQSARQSSADYASTKSARSSAMASNTGKAHGAEIADAMNAMKAMAHFEEVNAEGMQLSSGLGTQRSSYGRRGPAVSDEESRRRMDIIERGLQIDNYWDDLLSQVESDRRGGSSPIASLYAGNFGAGSGDVALSDKTKLATGNMLIREESNSIPTKIMNEAPMMSTESREVSLRHRMPVNVGIGLMFPISERLSVVSGLNYSYLYSSTRQQLSSGEGSVKQELHYVGIPVGVMYSLYRGGVVDFYVRGGGAIEKAVYARRTANYNLDGRAEVSRMGVRGVQFEIDGAIGADFRLARRIGLYLEAGAAYYFQEGGETSGFGRFTSYRTENPVNFTLRIGVRFNMKDR